VSGPPSGDAQAQSNPFASLGSSLGEPGGETKLYEVPRELIEIARARAAEPAASKGTLTPIAPRPNAELEATLAAYTSGLAAISGKTPSSQPGRPEAPLRQEVETLRSTPAGAYEESGTVLRRDAVPDTHPRAGERGSARVPLERKALLRSPVAPRPAVPRQAPHSNPVQPAAARGRPWLIYLGLCLIAGYCAHLLLSS
jgi:hypothetical protein